MRRSTGVDVAGGPPDGELRHAPVASGRSAATRTERLEAAIRRRALPITLLATAVLFALFWWGLAPAFDTDDDVHLMWVADGTSFHTPYEHLTLSSVLIGRIMADLYTVAGGVDWYPFYLYLVHLVAFATIVWVVLSDRRFRLFIHIPALVGFFGLFHLWAWMNLQFTTASLLLGVAALILYAAKAPLANAPPWLLFAAGAMLGVVAWIRIESFQAMIALAVPVVIATIRSVPWRRQAVFAGTALVVFLFAVAFENLYYAGRDDWQAYREFNQIRGDLHDTPRIRGIEGQSDLLARIGWSRNDAAMFHYWFFMDPDIYTTEAIDTIRSETRATRNDLGDGLREIRDREWTDPRLLFLGGLAVVPAVDGDRRRRLLALVTAAWVAGIGAVLIVFVRLPDRVLLPLLVFAGLAWLLLPAERAPPRPAGGARRYLTWAAGGIVVATLVATLPWAADRYLAESDQHRDESSALDFTLAGMAALDPDGVFVVEPALVGARLEVKHHVDVPVDMIALGWLSRSPMHTDHIASHGIPDLYEAIAVRPDVYLVARTAETPVRLYDTFMREHYGWRGDLRPVGRVGTGQELTAYDALVDYRVAPEGTALIESLPDGTEHTIRIDDTAGMGRIDSGSGAGGNGRISGWAVDPATGAVPELIVVMDDGRLAGLTLPSWPRRAVAEDIGLTPRNQRIGFDLAPRDSAGAGDVRVFAVFGDRAIELVPAAA